MLSTGIPSAGQDSDPAPRTSGALHRGGRLDSIPAGSWVELGGIGQVGGLVPSAFLQAGIVPPPSGFPRDFWVVRSHQVPQEMGSSAWDDLHVLQFDGGGRLIEADFSRLLAEAATRPVLVIVNGDLVAGDLAVSQGLWAQDWLRQHGALPADVIVMVFDWPSQQIFDNPIRDVNEKCRRAFIAGYHLAQVLQAFPSGSRVCLLGQSYGGRVVPSALHLLGGGELSSDRRSQEVSLTGFRPDLRLRAIVIEAADDHFWLNPGKKLGRALPICEGFLNLHNRQDQVLRIYPLLFTGDRHLALGQIGLLPHDRRRLGPLLSRYAQHDIGPYVGREHTMLGALAHPRVAAEIAPYVWKTDPTPAPLPMAAPEGLCR